MRAGERSPGISRKLGAGIIALAGAMAIAGAAGCQITGTPSSTGGSNAEQASPVEATSTAEPARTTEPAMAAEPEPADRGPVNGEPSSDKSLERGSGESREQLTQEAARTYDLGMKRLAEGLHEDALSSFIKAGEAQGAPSALIETRIATMLQQLGRHAEAVENLDGPSPSMTAPT